MKRAGSGEASLGEDLLPTSPMEIVTQQDIVLSDTENKSSDTPSSLSPLSLPGAGSEMEEKVAPVKPSRPKRHFSSAGTIESVNLDAIPLAIARLDNSAAKHKLSVKPKNQRVSKKHRRLARDRQNEQGGLESQPSLDQNGHLGEDKQTGPEEEPEPLDSEEEKRRREDYWRELEAKCKRQKAEAAEKRRLEEQRLQALERRLWEENRRQELLEEEGEEEEGQREELQLEAEKGRREEQRRSLEAQGWPEPGRRAREEHELLEAQAEAQQLEESLWRRQREEEEEEEERKRAEELRRQEEEETRLGEELNKQEEEEPGEAARGPEEEGQLELEDSRGAWGPEEEGQLELEDSRGPRSPEEEGQLELEDSRGPRSQPEIDLEEEPEEQENPKPKKQREISEEPSICEEQKPEAEPAREQQGKGADFHGNDHDHPVLDEEREGAKTDPPEKRGGQVEEAQPPVEKKEATAPERDPKVEELRWQEVDERQTMPRPYTFQVSSGGKQILFPKVNLSPVTPAKGAGPASAPQAPKVPRSSPASHALPAALSIPHTAILVTGAQLCGPAVNLNQIKDVACKSLLGLSEEKKHVDVPAVELPPRVPGDPRAGSGKARPPHESPGSVAALAEWASIRSRILKNAESDPRSERDQARPGDEPIPRGRCDSRGNLRKTPPVNAKFSIMPAWQKFSDGGTDTSKQSTEAESIRKRPLVGPGEETAPPPPPAAAHEHRKSPEKLEAHQEPADTTEGCKFAKDLPSFLVPSLPYPPQKAVAHAESTTTSDSDTTHGIATPDPVMPGGEEKASPFGIKLRRTNYSLRFHCDQQAEQKKKKRHSSTGDSADGGPPAVGSSQGETETEGVALKRGPSLPQERRPAPSTRRDSAESPSPPVAQLGAPPTSSQTPAPELDKAASKMPLAQKPALAPKPASQTPPSSPLSKLSRPYLVELLARRAGKPNPEPSEPCKEAQQSSDPQPPSPPSAEERKGQKRDEEEEVTERKPASPPLSAAEQEKPSQTPEAGRKEKPMLQSRHSLDGSKLTEKVETAQPLWITLALQKQKGFREQQATREERKQAREAKQAEKLSKENVSVSPQPGSSSVSRAGSLHKSTAQPEEKKPETAVSRLERREQLKKANTLPTSVTVEISDSAPPAPLVKEVTKRFSTPDAAPVSTEPAWLALAKRKAKAWSDCPQIIK
ncbi:capping protein-inhibiting regulator of actin dynamics isoform 2 [Daubentonia madagascariensis]